MLRSKPDEAHITAYISITLGEPVVDQPARRRVGSVAYSSYQMEDHGVGSERQQAMGNGQWCVDRRSKHDLLPTVHDYDYAYMVMM